MIEETEGEDIMSIVKEQCKMIDVDVRVEDIIFARRVGPQGAGHRAREIMVGFANADKREEILKALLDLVKVNLSACYYRSLARDWTLD